MGVRSPIVCVGVRSLVCYAVLCDISGSAIISLGKRDMPCGCYCYLLFPHGEMGLSGVCDCGIPRSYLLFIPMHFYMNNLKSCIFDYF